MLDAGTYWERVGHIDLNDLTALREDPAVLWKNGASSSSGINDRIAMGDARDFGGSLYLLYLPSITLNVYAPGMAFGNAKRRVQASFVHRGVRYSLWVTDPVVEKKLLVGPDGTFPIRDCFATISLGEPYEGYCYKFVAAIIPPLRAQG